MTKSNAHFAHLLDRQFFAIGLFFITALKVGLRISPVLSLRVGDVSHDGVMPSQIRIRRESVKGRRAGPDMPMHAGAVGHLEPRDGQCRRAALRFSTPFNRNELPFFTGFAENATSCGLCAIALSDPTPTNECESDNVRGEDCSSLQKLR